MIANGFAYCGDAGVQWGITSELVGPALLKEFVFGDDAVAMGKEVREHLKYFGAERYRLPSTEQFVACSVEHTVAEGIAHDFALLASRKAHCIAGALSAWNAAREAPGALECATVMGKRVIPA
jgi:hypothetical protein